MEEDIVEEISRKYGIKVRLVEELLKVCLFYRGSLTDAKNDIKIFYEK